MRLFSRQQFSPIALDLGGDSLKLLQVVHAPEEGVPRLYAAAAAVVPEGARLEPMARAAFLESHIRDLIKTGGFKGRRVVCSLPASETLVQHVELSGASTGGAEAGGDASAEELTAQATLQLQQRLGLDPLTTLVRCHAVAPREGGKREVVALAAPREGVMRTLAMTERLKLDVVGVQDEPIAILEAFRRCYNRRAEDITDTLCFIDIGATTTKVVIAQGGRMLFAKVIGIGGDAAARQLAEARDIPFAEARRLRNEAAAGQAPPEPSEEDRRRVVAPTLGRIGPEGFAAAEEDPEVGGVTRGSTGIPALDAQLEHDDDDGGGVATLAPPVARPAVRRKAVPVHNDFDGDMAEHLLDELQMCVRYFAQLRPSQPIRKLIFCGGEARHTRLCQQVAQRLRIAAQLGDPFNRLTTDAARPPRCTGVDPNAPQPGWAVPLGLCLLAVGG